METNCETLAAPVRFDVYRAIRRNGETVAFDPRKIEYAMTRAFLAVEGGDHAEGVALTVRSLKFKDELSYGAVRL